MTNLAVILQQFVYVHLSKTLDSLILKRIAIPLSDNKMSCLLQRNHKRLSFKTGSGFRTLVFFYSIFLTT